MHALWSEIIIDSNNTVSSLVVLFALIAYLSRTFIVGRCNGANIQVTYSLTVAGKKRESPHDDDDEVADNGCQLWLSLLAWCSWKSARVYANLQNILWTAIFDGAFYRRCWCSTIIWADMLLVMVVVRNVMVPKTTTLDVFICYSGSYISTCIHNWLSVQTSVRLSFHSCNV